MRITKTSTSWIKYSAPVCAGLICVATGFVLGRLSAPAPPDSAQMVCRPSAPALATAQRTDPVMLFYGNSLIHDHDWDIPDRQNVNCARQGLSLQQGVRLAKDLPEIAPQQIVLGFGSVELLRSRLSGTAPDVEAFETHANALVRHLSDRWPEARIIWITVPQIGDDDDIRHARALSAAAPAKISNLDCLNIDAALSLSSKSTSYDRLHLTAAAYTYLEQALIAPAPAAETTCP